MSKAVSVQITRPPHDVAPPFVEQPRPFIFVVPGGLVPSNTSLQNLVVEEPDERLQNYVTLRIACWFKTGGLVAESFWYHAYVSSNRFLSPFLMTYDVYHYSDRLSGCQNITRLYSAYRSFPWPALYGTHQQRPRARASGFLCRCLCLQWRHGDDSSQNQYVTNLSKLDPAHQSLIYPYTL